MDVHSRLLEVFRNLPTLETERLILRRLRLEDAEDIFEYGRDPEVARYVTWEAYQSLDETRDWLTHILRAYEEGTPRSWALYHKADVKVIGTCGFIQWIPIHSRAEVAFALSPPYWNLGLTTEAVNRCIDFGFKVGINRIQGYCLPENLASERVMLKAGMRYEGILRQYSLLKGEYRDLKGFAIVRSDRPVSAKS